ncbi:MAG TPA: prepilin-type N-terminal cleavage/methylation domain-containing protein [Terriglobales bacterium]|nr:prepilin-type N-terminal cleavage/methylation domain-containing protein [Terriglobales bacterium]
MRTRPRNPRHSQRGFSLIELLTVLVILTLVMGAVFSQMIQVQQRYQLEQTKLDMFQESREFMDQMSRDLHQAGYPSSKMYGIGVLVPPINNDIRNAVGLVQVTPTSIIFQGDVDGTGVVSSVRYTLISDPANPGNCPCWVQRSQVQKAPVDPLAQPTNPSNEVQNVINSAGTMTIVGQINLPTGIITNQALYGLYAPNPVFQAFDNAGNVVALPIDVDTNSLGIKTIKTIRITLNVLGTQPDLRTHMRPATTLTTSVRIEN